MQQQSMFTQGQDLPLFSQTAPRSKAQLFKRIEKPVQASLLGFECGLCLDTGLVTKDKKTCICQK